MTDNYKFEREFMSDSDVDEMLDELLQCIGKQIESEDNDDSITDINRVKQIAYVHNLLKYVSKGTRCKVVCELNEPLKSMGSVSIIGKNIVFKKPEWLMRAVEFASNLDVYPKTDGTVEMDFTFHGVTVPLESIEKGREDV